MTALLGGINRVADVWWFWVFHAGWQSVLVGAALLIVVALLRRWPATLRYWLLVIALLKFAMPPLWSAPIGVFSQIRVSAPATAHSELASTASAKWPRFESAASIVPSVRFDNYDSHDPRASSDPIQAGKTPPIVEDRKPSSESAQAAVIPTAQHSAPRNWIELLTWKAWLLGIHLIGTVAILLWVATQLRSVRRIIARSRRIEFGPIAESLQRTRELFPRPKLVRVLLSADAAAPFSAGLLRATVVLPESAERLPPQDLDAIVSHELTHVRRRDAWLLWVQVLLFAAWWFHPVIWLVNRGLRRAREECCDDAILLSGIATQREYCEVLLRAAHEFVIRPDALLACHITHPLHPLGDRLRRIMDTRARRSLRRPLVAMGAVAAIACLILPGVGRPAESSSALQSSEKIVEASPRNNKKGRNDSKSPATNPRTSRRDHEERSGKLMFGVGVNGSSGLTGSINLQDEHAKASGDGEALGLAKETRAEQDATVAALNENDSLNAAVRSAIVRGQSFLIGAQNPNGLYSDLKTNIDHEKVFVAPTKFQIGQTSLAVLALLRSGMKRDDPVIAKSVKFLRSSPLASTDFWTYENSLEIAALVAVGDWKRDGARIAALAQSLEAKQIKSGAHQGMWSYWRQDVAAADNSNTQFAVFGLHEAAKIGVPIKWETWDRTAEHFVKHQNQDGGWGYHNGEGSTGSMTAGAIASIILSQKMLTETKEGVTDDATRKQQANRMSLRDRAVKQGSKWLAHHFTVTANPGQGTSWVLYYLYGIGRAGRESGQRLLGRHDWYREAATFIVAGQSQRDGSWHTATGTECDKVISTSFALLSLCNTPGDVARQNRK